VIVTSGCVFCEVISGKRAADVVFEDEGTLGFLDHRPLFPGHVLVLPRLHYETLGDLPERLVPALFGGVQLIARAVESGLGVDGTFVAMNNRVSQSILHLHVHVVPRSKGDGLRGFFWPRHPYRDAEHREHVRSRIASAVQSMRSG